MKQTPKPVEIIETCIEKYTTGTVGDDKVSKDIRLSLLKMADLQEDPSRSYADVFEDLANLSSLPNADIFSTVIIRLISCKGLLPENIEKSTGRFNIVKLIEKNKEVISLLPKEKKSQNHEKILTYIDEYSKISDELQILTRSISELSDLVALQNQIMRNLNRKHTKVYLTPLGFQETTYSIERILSLVKQIHDPLHDRYLTANLQKLLDTVDKEIKDLESNPIFFIKHYFLPFLNNVKEKALLFQSEIPEKFYCKITPFTTESLTLHEIPKKYPLHLTDFPFKINIPLIKSGPGTAFNVNVEFIAEHCKPDSGKITLGDIESEKYNLPHEFTPLTPRNDLEIHYCVEWNVHGQSRSQTCDFALRILAQRRDIDWDELSRQNPYSIEVAEGKNFFGRKDVIRRLKPLFEPDRMESCCITGQKRVGKSSLALNAKAQIEKLLNNYEYHVEYLDCNGLRQTTDSDTFQHLGQELESLLVEQLPRNVNWDPKDYSSSLYPLGRLLNLINKQTPNKRFVIILDEFDEINEELYRDGVLADTFFSNLRYLASNHIPNIAFILVGAEKMENVMFFQGERLNKFASESLDSFDIRDEWEDYCNLVEKPVEGNIKVHEVAIQELFDLTSGHPYFTNLLCKEIFQNATKNKDAEVYIEDVKAAAEIASIKLDKNHFSHFWRDGINEKRSEIEIVALKRFRLLVGWARAITKCLPATIENISDNTDDHLDKIEVKHLVEDFCRRNVFKQTEKEAFNPSISLFASWLQNGGYPRLISDQLGDKIAAEKQFREERAVVKSEEVIELVKKWDIYQSKPISPESVRAWIDQVDNNEEKRILFKLLQNLRFISDTEIKEKFEQAHPRIISKFPKQIISHHAQRRKDIYVTFGDGFGKSGSYYANLYASENRINVSNCGSPKEIILSIKSISPSKDIGVILVDDMVGTGRTLVDKLTALGPEFLNVGIGTNIPLSIVVYCGTKEGEEKVRSFLVDKMRNTDLQVCETLGSDSFAFTEKLGIWETEGEKSEARMLIKNLGMRIQKKDPLGYADQGLLLTFSRNCPNNTLPIIHGKGKSGSWKPIFERIRAR